MEEKLREFEAYRASVCKKANKFLFLGIASMVLSIMLMMYTGEPMLILGIVLGVVFIIVNSSMKAKLSGKFKEEITTRIVKDVYPNSRYVPNGGIEFSKMMEPGLLAYPDRYFAEDYLASSYDGVDFEMCDFTFQERHVTTDSRGRTRTTYVTYAKGRYIIIDFKREFNEILKVVEGNNFGVNTSGLEKIQTESVDFNKKFKVYTSNDLTAFYVLTPQIQLKILELESKFKGSLYLAFMHGKLFVYITDGVSILDINASQKVSMETYKAIESQLLVPAAIINELGLNEEKFSNGDAI